MLNIVFGFFFYRWIIVAPPMLINISLLLLINLMNYGLYNI